MEELVKIALVGTSRIGGAIAADDHPTGALLIQTTNHSLTSYGLAKLGL